MKHDAPTGDLSIWNVGVLAVGLYEDEWANDPTFESLDGALDGKLRPVLSGEEFKAKAGASKMSHTLQAAGPQRLFFFGLGKRSDLQLSGVRDFVHAAMGAAGDSKCGNLGVALPGGMDFPGGLLESQMVMAAELGRYNFGKYQEEAKPSTVQEVSWRGLGDGSMDGTTNAKALAAGVARTRDLVNEPPGVCTPGFLLANAKEIASRYGLKIEVYNRAELNERGFGCLVGVSLGSDEEAYLIELTYTPANEARSSVALIGKGITFDSGGYDLKPAAYMLDMKTDMAGAATVLGVIQDHQDEGARGQREVHLHAL